MTELAREVDDMMKQLQDAEKELKRKQEDANQDMMMAGMVSCYSGRWMQRLAQWDGENLDFSLNKSEFIGPDILGFYLQPHCRYSIRFGSQVQLVIFSKF